MTRIAANWLTKPLPWRGLRVTVMGLGAFGGGEGAARFLAEQGALVTVTDLKPHAALQPAADRVAALRGVTLKLGSHDPTDFTETDLLVVNPAVQRSNEFLSLAIAAGVSLTSEMNLFWMQHRGRTIGVTGSNGKSTTTTLIHAMLQSAGIKARIGGNIGRSLLPEVENIGPDEWTVLELSSFLNWLTSITCTRVPRSRSSRILAAPNHQDRHASLEEYRDAKQTILRWQRADDVAVLNADDTDVALANAWSRVEV
ncbi:MAG: Mur ligase family protein [Planctomycetaceae bacterium]